MIKTDNGGGKLGKRHILKDGTQGWAWRCNRQGLGGHPETLVEVLIDSLLELKFNLQFSS